MTRNSGWQFLALPAVPAAAFVGAMIETLAWPSASGSYVMLAFVLASPVLMVWLVRLLRQDV